MSVVRRVVRGGRVAPRREAWHHLQDFAGGEADQAAMRDMRARDLAAAVLAGKHEATKKPSIDWKAIEESIAHKDIVAAAKDFYESRMSSLDAFAKEDHKAAVAKQDKGWDLFDASVASCTKSVEKAEELLANGSRALWISAHNPNWQDMSVQEYLDVDQYFSALVDRALFYDFRVLNTLEPDSKDAMDADMVAMKKKWEATGNRSVQPVDNRYLSERPSWEYYDKNRAQFVEHMMYFLTKSGLDYRFFPETVNMAQHREIVQARTNVYNVLTRRKRFFQTRDLAREAPLELCPKDLGHHGEGYFAKLVEAEKQAVEAQVHRLMGNYIFLSEPYIPVQTQTGALRAMSVDGGAGTFFSLGSDVHCLFYLPSGNSSSTLPTPVESWHSLLDHMTSTGTRIPVAFAQLYDEFYKLLDTRREGWQGSWFTAPGETQADAFLRRLKADDPARPVYEQYVAELKERFSKKAAVSGAEFDSALAEVERKYVLECEEYGRLHFASSEDPSKSDQKGKYVTL